MKNLNILSAIPTIVFSCAAAFSAAAQGTDSPVTGGPDSASTCTSVSYSLPDSGFLALGGTRASPNITFQGSSGDVVTYHTPCEGNPGYYEWSATGCVIIIFGDDIHLELSGTNNLCFIDKGADGADIDFENDGSDNCVQDSGSGTTSSGNTGDGSGNGVVPIGSPCP